MMLYDLLICRFGGVKIMLFCCLVKCGIGKTRVMEGEVRCDEVEKESREDMFLPILAEKLF
jgi:hypothetical protein